MDSYEKKNSSALWDTPIARKQIINKIHSTRKPGSTGGAKKWKEIAGKKSRGTFPLIRCYKLIQPTLLIIVMLVWTF